MSYSEKYQFNSIDCSKGLQKPNPALTFESKTIDLDTTQKFTFVKPTTKTINLSAFSME